MGRLSVQILLAANRLLPRPALPGPAAPLDYSRWEHDTADALVELWNRAGGPPPRRVLDMGCGLGGKTHRLAEMTGGDTRWVGLDVSLDHLEKAANYHLSVDFAPLGLVAADAARLPCAPGSFDRIISSDTLEHLPDPRRSLAEMARCLAPSGRLLMLFTPWGSPRGSHLGDLLHFPWCQLLFSSETLREATVAAAEREAALGGPDPDFAQRIRRYGRELVEHFEEHVHPTRIADLRAWIRGGGDFEPEAEIHVGPGPLAKSGWLGRGPWEEWLTANYGVVLRRR